MSMTDDQKLDAAWIGLSNRIKRIERQSDGYGEYWIELESLHDRIDKLEGVFVLLMASVLSVGLIWWLRWKGLPAGVLAIGVFALFIGLWIIERRRAERKLYSRRMDMTTRESDPAP